MPTYEYRCKACGHEFEQFQSITARPLRTCPACRRAALQRLIGTGAAILFRGSGFYQTDYRSESYRKAAAAESKPAGGNGDAKGTAAAKADSPAGAAKPAAPDKPARTKKKDKAAAR